MGTPEPAPARSSRKLEDWFATAGTYAGGVAALAGFVYLVGGMVMWLRFRTAHLPPDQGVALMTKDQLFVIGLRLMVIPTLVTGTLAWVLADRAAHENERGRGPLGTAALVAALVLGALLVPWAFAVAGWPVGLAVLLDALIVAGGLAVRAMVHSGERPDAARPAPRWLTPAIAGAVAALILVLCLAVPELEVDDRLWVRLLVAVGALLAMLVPGLLVAVRRLPWPLPPAAWYAVAALAVLAAMAVASSWWTRLAALLGGAVVVGGVAAAAFALSGRARRRLQLGRWAPAVLAIVAVGLIVPWSFASATWPLGVGLLTVVWLWQRRRLRDARLLGEHELGRRRRRLIVSMATAAVVAAAIVSIGRQLDEPVQLLHATVTFKDRAPAVEGAYVSASGDLIYVGDQARRTIDAIPRDTVRQIAVGPPDERAPNASLLSKILPGEQRFSVRPLEVWCNGERYGWFEAAKVCATQPRVLWAQPDDHERFLDRLGMPVRVQCPKQARDTCRGWVVMRSVEPFGGGTVGIPRPVAPEPVPFAVGVSKSVEVCATLSANALRVLRGTKGERPVAFELLLAHDPQGRTVLFRTDYQLLAGHLNVHDLALGKTRCEPKLLVSHTMRGRAVDVTVSARPAARGIRPWHVEGRIGLTATSAGRPPRPLAEQPLRHGRAAFTVELPRGHWTIAARYRSVAGLPYTAPSPTVDVTVPGGGGV